MSNRPGRKMARTQATRRRPNPAVERVTWTNPAVLVGVGVVALVIVAGIIAFSLAGGDDDGDTVAAAGQTATFDELVIEGVSLPQMPESGDDSALGMAAPPFSTVTFAGESTRLATDDGTGRVIGFFAHWCPHCQAELPRVVDYLTGTGLPDGVEVVAVSTSVTPDRGNYPPSSWFEREAWPDEVLLDDEFGRIADAYGLRNFPMWVVVSPDGTVIERTSGELSSAAFAELVELAAS